MANTDKRQYPIQIVIGHGNYMSAGLIVSGFGRYPRFNVIGCGATSSELLSIAGSQRVDVALIHVSLHDGPFAGVAAIHQLHHLQPHVRSVLLVQEPERDLAVDAFRAGAKGIFCSSNADFKLLCKCVTQVHAGQIWASSSDLSYVIESLSQPVPVRVIDGEGTQLLSKREEDVVRLLVEGLSNKDIARELQLSEHTVKNYMFKIFDKLGVSNRVEVALYAVSSTKRAQATLIRTGKDLSEPRASSQPQPATISGFRSN